MIAISIYALVTGGLSLCFVLYHARYILIRWFSLFLKISSRHLMLPVVLQRHKLWGPWTRAGTLAHIVYIAINTTLVFFESRSLTRASRQAGELALINMIFPLACPHLGFLADLLGITWHTTRRIHRATGWIVTGLISFHTIIEIQNNSFRIQSGERDSIYLAIGVISLAVLVLVSFRCLRYSYEFFLRCHQILASLFVYGTWRHISAKSGTQKLYFWINLGILGFTTALEISSLCYHNGILSGGGAPRAFVSFSKRESTKNGDSITGIQVRIILPRPIYVQPGQYINLWLPSLSFWAWTQTHPFMITSWRPGRQDFIELLVQPCNGLTSNLLHFSTIPSNSSISLLAIFTGPHGKSEDIDQYESVLLVASGFGIAAVIPYMKKMLHGFNTCTLKIRRIHLVWQIGSIDMTIVAQSLLNSLLEDDIIDRGYILSISIYVQHGLAQSRTLFGKHERVCFYQGDPDYRAIISLETSGTQIERLPSIRDEQGRTLVMVSVHDQLRDNLREIVRDHLHLRVNLSELEYQPK